MINVNPTLINLWNEFNRVKCVYAILHSTNIYVNEVVPKIDVATVRVFIDEKNVENYRKYLIESNEMKPSELKIVKIDKDNLNEVFDKIKKSVKKYGHPVKVSLTTISESFDLLAEEEIFHTKQLVN